MWTVAAPAFRRGEYVTLTVIAGALLWREQLDWARGIGIALIVIGILVINLFSKAAAQ